MKLSLHKFITISLILILPGCVQYSLINAGLVELNGISFSTKEAWSKAPYNLGKYTTLMTRDGMQLSRLILVHGVPEGKGIFRDTNKDTPLPKFNPKLLPHELENFIKSSLINSSHEPITIKTTNLRPIELDGTTGVAFDIQYFAPSGLLIKGKSIAAIKHGQFYAMIVTAAKMHYFELYKEDFSSMISSFRV